MTALTKRSLWMPDRNLLLLGVILLVIAAAMLATYWDGLAYMVKNWGSDEYSHGYLIPLVAVYLAWQKQQNLLSALQATQRHNHFQGAWLGIPLLVFGLFLYFLGELGTVYTIIQYGFLVAVYAITLLALGWRGALSIRNGLFYLVFMIPLPSFLYYNLSASLQLVSSEIGVHLLRLMQVSVYLEGNIIDLGNYKLQVAEACSGLRYLFPLLSFSFLLACFYRRAFFVKLLIVLSALPITIVMNSIRIAVIGLSVDIWGIHMAEGVLHAFEGWVIFLGCLALLTLEIWLIERLFFANNRLDRAMNFEPAGAQKATAHSAAVMLWQGRSDWYLQHVRRPLLAGLALVVLTALASLAIDQREEIITPRSHFSTFPLLHNGWIGREQGLGAEIEQTLKFSDYISADYIHPDQTLPVNLYVAYYESQRKGASVHSPRSCIPGDGWVIKSLDTVNLAEKFNFSPVHGQAAPIANRVVITRGNAHNLVYYWFDQRGRVFSNEYLAKWYIFWDSLVRGRSDGALVRLVTPIAENEDMANAETRLLQFAKDIDPLWNAYLPD